MIFDKIQDFESGFPNNYELIEDQIENKIKVHIILNGILMKMRF